jgi:N-acetylglutamate synthase-like GNAT family acetyltransferase
MKIRFAQVDDISAVLALQRLAYQSEAALYDDFNIPPLLQSFDELREDFDQKVVFKMERDGKIIGSVRGFCADKTAMIERLIVHPECQRQGLGNALLEHIEAHFESAHRFELFTGHKSHSNLQFYQQRGYTIFKQEPISETLTLVFLQKVKEINAV